MTRKRLLLGCLGVCLIGFWNLQTASGLSEELPAERKQSEEAAVTEEEKQLRFLSENQKLWCDEVTRDAEDAGKYSVTDLDRDGYLEIAQNINGSYYYYQEICEREGEYSLKEAGEFAYIDYIMGVPGKPDAENEGGPRWEFESEETIEGRQEENSFLPRSDAKWVFDRFVDEASSEGENGKEADDAEADNEPVKEDAQGKLQLVRTGEIYFGSGLELWLSGTVPAGSLYPALEKSYQSFAVCEENIHAVKEQLTAIFESEVYKETVSGEGKSMAVLDLDGDGQPELYLSDKKRGYPSRVTWEETEAIRRYRLTEDGELIEAPWEEAWFPKKEKENALSVLDMAWADLSSEDETDSSPVGLAYMRYIVWNHFFGKTPVSETEFMDMLYGENKITFSEFFHYFGELVEDES